MIEVKRPILLNDELEDVAMLHPSKGTLKLNMNDVSESTLTLEDKADYIPLHAWVKIYNQLGFAGIFRRTSRSQTIGTDDNYTLRHGIDILQDSVWDEETEFTGTKAQFIEAILANQTQLIKGPGDSSPRVPWVLGTCADTGSVDQDINYDNLLDLLLGTVEEGGDYYLSYDQTVWPWQVNVVAKPSAVESEFRLDRNIEKCRINDDDSELCTRLYLSVNAMEEDEDLEDETDISVDQNKSVVRVYDNLQVQELYGIIVKTADIDIKGDLPESMSTACPEADDWAEDFMARRAAPKLQIEIDGYVLKGITGSSWDESKIGTKSRVSLPDYASYIEERCVTVTYNDLYATPDKVTVSLANALPTYTKSFNSTVSSVSSLKKSSRASARKAESFEQHFEITDKAGNVLRQAGMQLDANGLLVYADDYENMVGAKFNVQADRIGMVVGTYDDGRNYIKAGEIALSINNTTGESTALINANHVNISATDTAHTLAGELEYDSQGRLIIKNAGGLYVKKTEQGVDAYYGVWREDTLTGGIIVQTINGTSQLTLRADKIDVDGIVTALRTKNLTVNEVNAGDITSTTLIWGQKIESNSDMVCVTVKTDDIEAIGDITCAGDIKITDSSSTLDVYGIDARDIVAKSLTLRSSQGGKLTCNDVDCSDIDCSAIDCTAVDASSWVEAASYWISGVNHAATWQDATYYTYDRTNSHKFYYEDTVGTSTVTGYLNGQLITAATSHTIHYLGY